MCLRHFPPQKKRDHRVTITRNPYRAPGDSLAEASMDARRMGREEALVHAITEADIGKIRALLMMGADPHKKVSSYSTVFTIACHYPDELVVKTLLEGGADPNKIIEGSLSPLCVAAWKHNYNVAKILLAAGADPNWEDSAEGACIIRAALSASFYGESRTIQLLLENGADPNAANCGGHTALICAAMSLSHHKQGRQYTVEAIRLLLEWKADPNLADLGAQTPLMYAAQAGDEEVARLLIGKGADTSRLDCRGKTAWDIAKERGNRHLKELLNGASIFHRFFYNIFCHPYISMRIKERLEL